MSDCPSRPQCPEPGANQAFLSEILFAEYAQDRGFAVDPAMSGPNFSPINYRFAIRDDEGDVYCHLVAGIAPAESDNLDDGQAEDFRMPEDAGWWLFCNSRLLLYAERSALTGWGGGNAAYHPQYRRFRGYVYLTSLNTELLPWNTTKTSVDQDSYIWRTVQGQMRTSLGQVQSVINRLKNERQHSEVHEDRPVSVALSNSRPVLIDELPEAAAFVAPAMPRRPRAPRTTQRIQYDVSLSKYREVANMLATDVISEVGRRTFDYFYEREVEQ